MSLRQAVLSLLAAESMSGYDIDRILDETYGYVWTAPHSQIYLTLRQLEKDGLVAAEETMASGRRKRIYHLLAEGHDELRRWAEEPITYGGERDIAHLKVSLMHLISLDAAEAHLRSHIQFYRERQATWEGRLEGIRSGRSRILRARLATTPPAEHAALVMFKTASYRGSIARANAEISWAEDIIEQIAELREGQEIDTPNAGE